MELNYSLNENDFLEHLLYNASKSKRIINQRRKALVILIIVCIACICYTYSRQESFPYLLLVFHIALVIAYKIYERKRYINHYKKYITELYKDRCGTKITLNFTENQIIGEALIGESKIKYEALSEINEIQDYYFLKILSSRSIIIPKRDIQNIDEFKAKLNEIKTKYNLKENIELNWKWK